MQSNRPLCIVVMKSESVVKGNDDEVVGLKFLSWLHHLSFYLCRKFPRSLIRLQAAISQFNGAMSDVIPDLEANVRIIRPDK